MKNKSKPEKSCQAFFNFFRGEQLPCRSRTTAQLEEYGRSRVTLFFDLLTLSLFQLVPPVYYFKYKLYRPQNKAYQYLYTQELPHFHDHSNQSFKHARKAAQLMNDKQHFSQLLHQLGLPTVLGQCYSADTLQQDISIFLQKKTVFCKPNCGSQSHDAFLIDYNPNTQTYELDLIQGSAITNMPDIIVYLKTVCSRNQYILIQPFLRDHPEIKKISTEHASTTVRIITIKSPENPLAAPTALYLQLEIPAQKIMKTNAHLQQYYSILPLDPHHLDVEPLYIQNQSKTQLTPAGSLSEELKILLRKAIADCITAHHQLLHLRSVAFDLIITKEGPVIIEANYNWGADMLYNVIHNDAEKSPHIAQQWLESVVRETKYTLR